jgi:hypothetical protein
MRKITLLAAVVATTTARPLAAPEPPQGPQTPIESTRAGFWMKNFDIASRSMPASAI